MNSSSWLRYFEENSRTFIAPDWSAPCPLAMELRGEDERDEEQRDAAEPREHGEARGIIAGVGSPVNAQRSSVGST